MTPMQDLIERAIAARLWFRENSPDLASLGGLSPAELRAKLEYQPGEDPRGFHVISYSRNPTDWILYDPKAKADQLEKWITEAPDRIIKQRMRDNETLTNLRKRIEDGWK